MLESLNTNCEVQHDYLHTYQGGHRTIAENANGSALRLVSSRRPVDSFRLSADNNHRRNARRLWGLQALFSGQNARLLHQPLSRGGRQR